MCDSAGHCEDFIFAHFPVVANKVTVILHDCRSTLKSVKCKQNITS